ncbi:MAG TPA: hypothetical protein VN642_12200 [Dongiaceae bacterium]|nr:hypothetical protein [Dongiaceae bacterium]
MKKIMKLIVLLLLTCGLAGCFQVDQVITLAPDGSGTVEETFMISRKIADSMSALAAGMSEQPGADGNDKSPPREQSFFKDDEIRKRAENYGADVRFVRMERLANDKYEGYKAVYSFKNINTLRLDQSNPGMPKQIGQGSESASKGAEFVFTPGKTAILVVKQQKKSAVTGENAPAMPPQAGETSTEDLAMVRQMFEGLRISTTLVIKGKVIESNATHRTGSTITLAEVDFGKILDKPELLAKMAAVQPGDQAAAMEMIKKVPGMKFDMNDELRVSFR